MLTALIVIAAVLVALALVAAGAALRWYYADAPNTADHKELALIRDRVLEERDTARTEHATLDTKYQGLLTAYNELDVYADGLKQQAAAREAQIGLLMDAEPLHTWNDVTGIFHMPVGPDRPDFTSEWNASDVQALRDRFDNNEQLALVGGGLSYADKRAEREMDDAA